MSDTPICDVWRLVDAYWYDDEPDCSTIGIRLENNGVEYAVACSGPKGMQSDKSIAAVRTAAAGLIRAAGGNMEVVGVGLAAGPGGPFDTGDQRAS